MGSGVRGSWMRNFVLLVTAVLVAIFMLPPAISVASATPEAPGLALSPKLYVTLGVGQRGATHFLPTTNITYKGASFTPESSGQGIRWFCIPHRAAGMTGEILLAGLTAPTPEKGILIRAYWIGIIGIAATLAWTIVSYFIIKSSSPHFKDHSEHLRKGLP